MYRSLLPGLSAIFYTVVTCLSMGALAATEFKREIIPQGYARTNLQIGKDLRKGENLKTGFMWGTGNRLQEGQYFELGFLAKAYPQSRLSFLIAGGGDSFHYSDTWASTFAIRNLFLEIDNKNTDPDFTLWFGSRMYRGTDIYLFDLWPLDSHNLLGGGVQVPNFLRSGIRFEAAVGTKHAQTVEKIDSAVDSISTEFNTQRYILIGKLEKSLPNWTLKINAEYQIVPSEKHFEYTYKTPDPNDTTKTIENTAADIAPRTVGIMLGGQVSYWTTGFWNNLFYNFGYGDVIGGVYAPYSDDSSLVRPDGTLAFRSRRGSQIHRIASTGCYTHPIGSVMYAGLLDVNIPDEGTRYSGVSTAIRPLYFLTDHLHIGGELDYVKYLEKKIATEDVDYVQLSGIVRYGFDRSFFGIPYIRAIYSHAFYMDDVTKYGKSVRQAFNASLGFELWL